MLGRAADGEGRTHDGVGQPLGDAGRQRLGDQRVGVERQVRPVLLGRAERHDHRAPAVRHLGVDLGPRERRQRTRPRRAGDAVEGRVEPAPRPRGLIDTARVELPEDEGVQMCLVLEERQRTGEGRGQSDQALSHRIEHRLETGEQIGLARGVGPRQREEGRGPPEQLLERPVGEVQHVPHRRQPAQQALHHLVLEV